MKIMRSKIQLWPILGLIVLLSATMTAYGSGPAPGTGDPHFLGPAITGTVTIEPSEAGDFSSDLLYTFEGKCQGMDITITEMPCGGPGDNPYSGVTEETLKEFFIFCVPLSWIPCVPDKFLDPTTPMQIHQVLSYEEIGSVKRAKILVLFLGN